MSSEQRSLAQAQGRIQTSKARCAVESVPFRLTNLMVAKVIASTPTQKREGTSPATYIWGKWLYGPASIFLRARYSLIVKQYDRGIGFWVEKEAEVAAMACGRPVKNSTAAKIA